MDASINHVSPDKSIGERKVSKREVSLTGTAGTLAVDRTKDVPDFIRVLV